MVFGGRLLLVLLALYKNIYLMNACIVMVSMVSAPVSNIFKKDKNILKQKLPFFFFTSDWAADGIFW